MDRARSSENGAAAANNYVRLAAAPAMLKIVLICKANTIQWHQQPIATCLAHQLN